MVAGVSLVTIVTCLPRRQAGSAESATPGLRLILALYFIPMFTFGRAFATVGRSPIYLPDVLLAVAVVLMARQTRLKALWPVPALVCVLALLALHSVYVGASRGYPAAPKGIVLAYYPLVAVVLAGWIAAREVPEALLAAAARYVLPLIPLGLAWTIVTSEPLVQASYGLYLGIAAAFAASRGVPNRRILTLATAVGVILLVAVSAKRGAALTDLIAPLVAWLASSRRRSGVVTGLVACSALAVIAAASLALSTGIVHSDRLPLVGHVIGRATGESQSAADNVLLRRAMWSMHCIRLTSRTHCWGGGLSSHRGHSLYH